MALCAGYVAAQSEMEALVLKLDVSPDSKPQDESTDTKKGWSNIKTNHIYVYVDAFTQSQTCRES